MLKFDLLIPICNMNNDGFNERLNNLIIGINNLPKDNSVHLILIEQIINEENPNYLNNVNLDNFLNVTKKFVHYPIFNKPWLFNIGVRNAKYNHLLFSEMDVSFNPGYLKKIEEYLSDPSKPGKNWFFAWNKIIYFNEEKEIEGEYTCSKGMREGGLLFCKK